MGKKVNKTRNKSSAWLRPVQDSLWSKIQSRTWLCPIQVHYWVKLPGKKSIAATVKSKSSMGQPWTENSRAVRNFSPHCSHHLHWSLWRKPTGSVCSQDGHGGLWVQPLSVHTSETVLTHYMSLPDIHTDRRTATRGRESVFEEVWEESSEHLTHKLWSVQIARTLAVWQSSFTAAFDILNAKC